MVSRLIRAIIRTSPQRRVQPAWRPSRYGGTVQSSCAPQSTADIDRAAPVCCAPSNVGRTRTTMDGRIAKAALEKLSARRGARRKAKDSSV